MFLVKLKGTRKPKKQVRKKFCLITFIAKLSRRCLSIQVFCWEWHLVISSSQLKWGDTAFLDELFGRPSVTLSCPIYISLTARWILFKLAQIFSKIELIFGAYVWARAVQGHGHNLSSNIFRLFLSAVYPLNEQKDFEITENKC